MNDQITKESAIELLNAGENLLKSIRELPKNINGVREAINALEKANEAARLRIHGNQRQPNTIPKHTENCA